MERGLRDEGFIRKALEMATSGNGRWIANQAYFNGAPDAELAPTAHAVLVTAVLIYVQNNKLEESRIQAALNAKKCGQARQLIDLLLDEVAAYNGQ